ncbi:MAG TPA: hypothetical protein VFK80_06050, partial [Limnochordia bacterium]|nr:hypothetical protein [Limnochordia bacterium]
MPKSTRRFLGAALAGAVLGGAGVGAAAQTFTVEMLDYNTQAMAYINNKFIPDFEAAHPGVKVTTVTSTWSTL